VGIFLLVDEIMKIESCDPKFFMRVLDVITTLQQRQLYDKFPTFVLITSLQLLPVSQYLVRGSGRRVKCVSLPIFCDADLNAVVDNLYDFFYKVLCIDRSLVEQQQLDIFGNLKNLIRIMVSVSGRHFRTLELATGVIYARLVSFEQDKKAREEGVHSVKVFKPIDSLEEHTQLSLANKANAQMSVLNRKGLGVDLAVRDIFISLLNNMDMGGVDGFMYEAVKELFFKLIVFPSHTVVESEIYDLEACNVVYVKSRDPYRRMQIVPRVSLPFMYHFLGPVGAVTCKALNLHTDTLLQMIGQQLSRPCSELPYVFESVMPIAELITVAACHRWLNTNIALRDIFGDDVIFQPWGKESLSVAPFVLQHAITLFTPTTHDIDSSNNHSNEVQSVCNAVKLALSSECNSVYIH
jgi:hypothetical protein